MRKRDKSLKKSLLVGNFQERKDIRLIHIISDVQVYWKEREYKYGEKRGSMSLAPQNGKIYVNNNPILGRM